MRLASGPKVSPAIFCDQFQVIGARSHCRKTTEATGVMLAQPTDARD
jgi:hypothetical protein